MTEFIRSLCTTDNAAQLWALICCTASIHLLAQKKRSGLVWNFMAQPAWFITEYLNRQGFLAILSTIFTVQLIWEYVHWKAEPKHYCPNCNAQMLLQPPPRVTTDIDVYHQVLICLLLVSAPVFLWLGSWLGRYGWVSI